MRDYPLGRRRRALTELHDAIQQGLWQKIHRARRIPPVVAVIAPAARSLPTDIASFTSPYASVDTEGQ